MQYKVCLEASAGIWVNTRRDAREARHHSAPCDWLDCALTSWKEEQRVKERK
ncbi:putative allantoicase [Clarias magur]|uniref:Putative allantoicase n=1 Tax=Clarias magur TaxID=1594786 RepID=A0A8J4UVD1_CLAMG|nr:putative allantoicase [Clarias magur]